MPLEDSGWQGELKRRSSWSDEQQADKRFSRLLLAAGGSSTADQHTPATLLLSLILSPFSSRFRSALIIRQTEGSFDSVFLVVQKDGLLGDGLCRRRIRQCRCPSLVGTAKARPRHDVEVITWPAGPIWPIFFFEWWRLLGTSWRRDGLRMAANKFHWQWWWRRFVVAGSISHSSSDRQQRHGEGHRDTRRILFTLLLILYV